jgi:Zn-dependent protease
MTENIIDSEIVNSIVGRVLKIEEITIGGGPNLPFAWRFRGRLVKDSAEAYDEIAVAFKPYQMTPIFREEDGRDTILLVDGVITPTPSNAWINLGLFLITVITVLMAGVLYSYEEPMPNDVWGMIKTILSNLPAGIPFGFSLLAILLTHEFGHYLAARSHHVAVSLPYFIPFIGGFGTMGAFIRLKEPPKNKRILHDIGIAGPLAGLVVAIPILVIGIALSPVEQLPSAVPADQGFSLEGNSILYLLIKYLVHGELLPAPASYAGMNPVLYWIKYFFTGMPTPLGGRDVFLHPLAWAGWAGLLVTALNLIPVGQLDGGHIFYVLFGEHANKAYPVALVLLLGLGFIWPYWWLWMALIFFLGRRHAEPLDQITQLDPARKALAIFALVVFVLVFTPVPLQLIVGS